MKPYIFVISLKQELTPSQFTFLLQFVREDKKSRILSQRIKQNADTMLIGELLAMYAIQKIYHIPMSKQRIGCREHGKPFLVNDKNIHFNISHSKNCVAVAVCDKSVGIDFQHIVPYRHSAAKRICTQDELQRVQKSGNPAAELIKLWTQKEAMVKMTGDGLKAIHFVPATDYFLATMQGDGYYLSVAWEKNESINKILH